jgi:hypothetical protein
VAHRGERLLLCGGGDAGVEELDARVARPAVAHAEGPRTPVDGQRRLERPGVLVEPVGRQVGDAVRADRAAQVGGLAPGPDELDLERRAQRRAWSHEPSS